MKLLCLLGNASAGLLLFSTQNVLAAAISGQGTWETTLQPRDLDGNMSTTEAYYDTVLNITWLANANLIGGITLAGAKDWITDLNTTAYLGENNWRLPSVMPANGVNFNYDFTFNGSSDRGYNLSETGTMFAGGTTSEMAHLFYTTLDNKAYCDPLLSTADSCSGPQSGWGLSNTGPFSNIQQFGYWSGTEYAPNSGIAWVFSFSNGNQSDDNNPNSMFAWAVHDGDVGVAVIPLPPALWLFGSGLLGLVGIARRKVAQY